MSVDFDDYRSRYREAVDDSISFIGQDVDFFAEVKALRLLDVAKRRLGDVGNAVVLDIGCGVGVTDAHLLGHVGEVHGVDITPGVIDEARTANPGAEYLTYDGHTLPYEDGTFDLAFAICVVHHVPPLEWATFAAEMRRVLRPGGLAMIFEHNPLNPLTLRAVRTCAFDEDAVLLRRSRTVRLVREAGLSVVERRYTVFFPFAARALSPVDRRLGWLPAGAQYYVAATRPS